MHRFSPFLAVVLAVFASPALQAGEGMWPPHQLSQLDERLASQGLEIDPSRLSDLTAHPMNAVISLGGCTASFVSPDGLVVTNHHCAYRSIQYNSSEENNLLEDGFLAKTRGDELFAGPGSRVLVTVEVTDVTDQVLADIPRELGGIERYQALEDRRKKLVASCEEEPGHRCWVRSFYGGLEYHLIKALEIRDVRLVYAPAGGIGNYGGDVDNWLWPRHTGDYSFYRAYVGPGGKPADFSEENVPFRPPHHLKVATDGLQPGSFVMVAGYPGRTNRYRLAAEVKNQFEWYYPVRKRLLLEVLAVIEEQTADRPDAAIKYAGFIAGINNSTKNYEGMLQGFAQSDMLKRKRAHEDELREWAAEGGAVRSGYVRALDALEALVAEDQRTRERDLYRGMIGRNSMISAARTLYRLSLEKQKPDAEREPGYQQRDLRRIEERLARLQRTHDPAVDRAILRHLLPGYAAIPADQHIAAIDAWFGIEGNSVDDKKLDRLLREMYAKTALGELETRMRWFEAKPEAFEQSDDPFIEFAVALHPGAMELEKEQKEITGQFNQLRPRYMEAIIALRAGSGEPVYPDANGTLRVTFGNVEGYSPRDGILFTPFTTLTGLLEKENGIEPFKSPEALLEAAGEGRFGRWADPKLGSVPVDYLSNVDTTGGNSGSPTLNGRGELVGLLFDGVWESILSDWDFLPARTRSIHVDIRYVLWIMEQVDHADHLLREMGVTGAKETPGR